MYQAVRDGHLQPEVFLYPAPVDVSEDGNREADEVIDGTQFEEMSSQEFCPTHAKQF
jgi:hypothetical protein